MTRAVVLEHPAGLTWVANDPLERASHALADDGRVWLVDPTDDAAALERAAALGDPAAVIQLLDRHRRNGARIARRLGVPLLRMPDEVPGAPFVVLKPAWVPGWRETALWWPQRRALVVAEVVGTASHYALGDGEAGIHPMLRLRAPALLRGLRPEHLLVGHGPPLHGDAATAALEEAYASSRRDLPRVFASAPTMVRAALDVLRR